MKMSAILPVVIALFAMVACGQKPKYSSSPDLNGSQTATEDGSLTYNLKGANCDTSQRVFNTKLEMCLSLQIDHNNNDCAADQRESLFHQKSCDALVSWKSWDPVKAEVQLKNTNGQYVECSLVDGAEQMTQFTSENKMQMNMKNIRAVIVHQRTSEHAISLRMEIYNQQTNDLLLRTQKLWKDEAPGTLNLPETNPVLSCLVTIAHDPRHE